MRILKENNKDKIYFFAYGEQINISKMIGNVRYKDLGKVRAKNLRLCFKGIYIGVPTLEKAEGHSLVGRLYEINKKDFSVSRLKITEGYLHTKVALSVYFPDKRKVRAFTFMIKDIVNENTTHKYNYITLRRDMYRVLKAGYDDLGLSTKRLEEAAIYSMQKCYEGDRYNGETGQDY